MHLAAGKGAARKQRDAGPCRIEEHTSLMAATLASWCRITPRRPCAHWACCAAAAGRGPTPAGLSSGASEWLAVGALHAAGVEPRAAQFARLPRCRLSLPFRRQLAPACLTPSHCFPSSLFHPQPHRQHGPTGPGSRGVPYLEPAAAACGRHGRRPVRWQQQPAGRAPHWRTSRHCSHGLCGCVRGGIAPLWAT